MKLSLKTPFTTCKRRLLHVSSKKSYLRQGAPKPTYLNQISSHILQSGEKSLEAGAIRKMAMNKSEWSQLFVVSKKKSLQTDLLSSDDDERSLDFDE